MTFNQWFSGKYVRSAAAKMALEDLWKEPIEAGIPIKRVIERMNDIWDNLLDWR